MVVHCYPVQVGDNQVFETACEWCGGYVGNLTGQEVVAMSTGEYGPVLCFDCESVLCPSCHLVETGGKECTLCLVEEAHRGLYYDYEVHEWLPLPF